MDTILSMVLNSLTNMLVRFLPPTQHSSGKTIYISGQVALDPEGNVIGEGDAEAQAEYIWSNIKKVLQIVYNLLIPQ